MVAESAKKIITLAEENGSGQKGTVLFEEIGNKVRVIVVMGMKTKVQPAHIHIGRCPGVGVVRYPLNNVIAGKSVTMLDVTIEDLLNQVPLSVNVHKSIEEVGVSVACGLL